MKNELPSNVAFKFKLRRCTEGLKIRSNGSYEKSLLDGFSEVRRCKLKPVEPLVQRAWLQLWKLEYDKPPLDPRL